MALGVILIIFGAAGLMAGGVYLKALEKEQMTAGKRAASVFAALVFMGMGFVIGILGVAWINQ